MKDIRVLGLYAPSELDLGRLVRRMGFTLDCLAYEAVCYSGFFEW